MSKYTKQGAATKDTTVPKAKPARARGTIRADSVLAKVYNDGLCVYIWDEGHAARIREMLANRKSYRGCSPEKSFFENLASAAFGRAAAEAGLAAVYTLEQDDEVAVEVIVGPDLTADELAGACWLEPQRARLSLPTGRLRIDTPNTMPLDPDEKSDPGALVSVAPGDYVLTVYRVDWSEMKRRGCRRKMPSEVLLLTPSPQATRVATAGPVLPFTPRQEPAPGAPRIRANESGFACKVAFLGYWENYGLNITRAAAAKLGLAPGHVLRFTVEKWTFDLLFLGSMTRTDFLRYYGCARLEAATASAKEFAIGEWSKLLGRTEGLICTRVQAKKCIPERLQDRWVEAKATVLPERWEMPQPAETAPAAVAGKTVRACVVLASAEEVTLNVEPAHLAALGAETGALLTLTAPGAPPRTVALGAGRDSLSHHLVLTRGLIAMHAEFFGRMLGHGTPYRFFTLESKGWPAPFTGNLPLTPLGDGESWPVVGLLEPMPGEPERTVLRLTPFQMDGSETPPAKWAEGLGPGTTVELCLRGMDRS